MDETSYGQLGLISEPLMISKFHHGIHDCKRQENTIYTLVILPIDIYIYIYVVVCYSVV